jgi:hypothetical protein
MLIKEVNWRYYEDLHAFVAFTGNVPAFNVVVGYVRRFGEGWLWEVRDDWFHGSSVLRSGFYHKYHNAIRRTEWEMSELWREMERTT